MKEKDEHEELHSRREFFKRAAKGTLPILVMGLGFSSCGTGGFDELLEDWKEEPNKGTEGEGETGSGCTDCSGGCSTSCKGGCKSACGTECSTNCKNSCLNGCDVTCKSTCKGSCKGTCRKVTR